MLPWTTSSPPNPKAVVRRGYDALSTRYRADDAETAQDCPGSPVSSSGYLPAGA